jgi:hypothetical protein
VVAVSKTTSNLTLDGLSKTILDKSRQAMMDFNLLLSNSTKVGTIPAQQLLCTFMSSDHSLQLHPQTLDIWMME